MTVFQNFEVSRGIAASWKGEGSRWLRQIHSTDRSAYIGLNHSDQYVLRAVVLTHCSPVHFFCEKGAVFEEN
jgi:hypothetical protein